MSVISLLIMIGVGVAVLFLGRQLFWLFVGAVGFLIGFNLATQYLAEQPEWVALLIGLAIGVLAALIAVPLQRLAVGVAGFLAGAYALYTLLTTWEVTSTLLLLGAAVIGGILGAILVSVLFDWALIILSSSVGASLLIQPWELGRPLAMLLFVGLLIFGIIVQALQMRRVNRRTVVRRTEE